MRSKTDEDDHHFRAAGRRWRRTDPAVPEPLRQALVNELMAARRAVKAARGNADDAALGAARARVQDAKVALGERGHPWWEPQDDSARRERLAAAMRALLRSRRSGATICPSEAARAACGEGWRNHMTLARSVAFDLRDRGQIEVLQRGAPVDRDVRGAIRLQLAAGTTRPG